MKISWKRHTGVHASGTDLHIGAIQAGSHEIIEQRRDVKAARVHSDKGLCWATEVLDGIDTQAEVLAPRYAKNGGVGLVRRLSREGYKVSLTSPRPPRPKPVINADSREVHLAKREVIISKYKGIERVDKMNALENEYYTALRAEKNRIGQDYSGDEKRRRQQDLWDQRVQSHDADRKYEVFTLGFRGYSDSRGRYGSCGGTCNENCADCWLCADCRDCTSCVMCENCRDCENCACCLGGRGLRYCIEGVQYTKEEYEDFMSR